MARRTIRERRLEAENTTLRDSLRETQAALTAATNAANRAAEERTQALKQVAELRGLLESRGIEQAVERRRYEDALAAYRSHTPTEDLLRERQTNRTLAAIVDDLQQQNLRLSREACDRSGVLARRRPVPAPAPAEGKPAEEPGEVPA